VPFQIGDRLALTIDDIAFGGEGVGRVDDFVVFVPFVLVREAGDSWAIVDPGSTNGIYLNDSLDAIPTDELVPVAEGDRIHIGAWTTLTLHSTAPDEP